ncbi:MAG: AarF/UbiB family protein [Burkholderiaceae bacterium]|nr:AarF/UbiB family protein [Burkholderiaceae bacterium]
MRIGLAFAGFVLWWGWHRGLMRCDDHPVAERFATLLQALGTTFVKLGQHLSLRADLLPDAAQQALARLQDRVGPFPAAQAERQIEQAFGRPCAELFARFDLTPLAAGSVAQIHRAALPDGSEVIVKVRRPGAPEQVESDMRLLRTLAVVAQVLLPPLRRWAPVALIDEIAANLRLEMDLAREARFVRRFADAWRASPDVHIPDVVDGLCTAAVMVQRFSSGLRIESVHGAEREAVAKRLVDSYVTQLFEHGLFHGDPHPGNLFVLADGRICFHDFGIVGRLDRRQRRALTAFALAFVEQDADWVVDAWLDLGMLGAQADRHAFVPVVQSLLADCAERPLREWSLPMALGRLVAAGRSQAVRLPADLLVLTRTMLLLEGTVRALAPGFSIFETLSRHVRAGSIQQAPKLEASKRLAFELGGAASDLPALLAQRLHGALARERLFEIAIVPDAGVREGVERASRRIALALVTLGLYIAASLLMQHAVGPQWRGMPLLALAGYALAIRFTISIARGRAPR